MSLSRSRTQRIFALAITIVLIFVGDMTAAQRAIPDDNLAYPVLIVLSNGATGASIGTGSGFYLSTDTATYLVTAKHVLFEEKTNNLLATTVQLLSYSKDPADSTRNLLTLDLLALQGAGNIKPHLSEDVVVVKVALIDAKNKSIMTVLPGVTTREVSKGGVLGVALATTKPFAEVLTGNDVIEFGYPTSLGLAQLREIDIQHPLLRKGIVAGTNPATKSIILDCPSYFGNSGGPVLEIDRDDPFHAHLYIVGVVNKYVPFADSSRTFQMLTNSGYSIATPMDFVLELVK